VKPLDLIKTAETLLKVGGGNVSQANLCRAHSTIFYAMFHALAGCCADMFVGGTGSDRGQNAWRQVYRALEHGYSKQVCGKSAIMSKFPKSIEDFGSFYVAMQAKRHAADYDPSVRLAKSEVKADLEQAKVAIESFRKEELKHRRAFCAYVLLKNRDHG
jgi:uncharacterized protein (UPF0332 family)